MSGALPNGPGYTSVFSLGVFDDGGGPALFVGGDFMVSGPVSATCFAKWTGSSWVALGTALNDEVESLGVFDDGNGPALYAGGRFTSAGGVFVGCIAKWDHSGWSALGSGTPSSAAPQVFALAAFDDGSGPSLFAGGGFDSMDNVPAKAIARWNGTSWSAVGGGMGGINPFVSCLIVFDDGSGPALYAGGGFTTAGGAPAHDIARWDGTHWSALGSGAGGGVTALVVFDDGSGPALYASGSFTGLAVNNVAKWNGSSWIQLGSGMSGGPPRCLGVFDAGTGANLIAAGDFTSADGVSAYHIAKWNGTQWSAVGFGVDNSIYALTTFDDGTGPAVFVGGAFHFLGNGTPAGRIAKWDGSSWSPLGSGMNGDWLYALAAFDDGSGPALYAGGDFWSALDSGDSYLAKWGNPPGCGAPGVSTCEPGTSAIVCPCSNPPGNQGVGCDNSSSTGGAQLSSTGIARLAFDTVEFTTSGEKPTATSIVLQGDQLASHGVVFGQGVRCVAGNLKRLYIKAASGGSITAPQATDLHVHARSAELGDTIAPGTHRYYGVYYRDPTVLGGCPAASTFNITQQLDVLWSA
jgi:hypothetical protein